MKLRTARHLIAFPLLVLVCVAGCGPEDREQREERAALQRQITALTRTVEEMQERVNTLQSSMQRNLSELSALRAEVERLRERSVVASAPAAGGPEQASPPLAPSVPQTHPTVCAQVWKLIGQGKDQVTIARTVNVSPDVVQACERQVGRARSRR
ncbi:MAG: hypothetical protein NZ578_01205 [Candidatus Binatia bacterium]|nr:hypothetical protein [Candidatus Binatia bacterium]